MFAEIEFAFSDTAEATTAADAVSGTLRILLHVTSDCEYLECTRSSMGDLIDTCVFNFLWASMGCVNRPYVLCRDHLWFLRMPKALLR